MKNSYARTALSCALGSILLGMASTAAWAQSSDASSAAPAAQPPPATAAGGDAVTQLDTVTVSGYRRSIQFSTDAKRDSVGFADTVFAEDIGKFPDMNIAESLNRIPGVQLSRDVNGEGLNIAIRGLGTSFTKTTLNGASIATASIGLNAQNQNREVDLNLFPTEFFTQLTVSKTPTASMLEGGVSGVVDMRSARPFDRPGVHFTYQAQADWNSTSEKTTPRGAFMGSWTNEQGTFGALFGVASVRSKLGVRGFESVGWTNPGLTYTQCGLTPPAGTPATNQPAACNVNGGGNWRIPDRVPATAGSGLTTGETIDAAWLLARNPGLSIDQISDALIPRLGRSVYMNGDRDRDASVMSLEWRPSDSMHFYLDTLYSEAKRTTERISMNLIGRNGNMIPLGMQLDQNNVVTSATFANAQYFLEARPYREEVKFWSVNPGAELLFGADQDIKLNVQANATRSWLDRESPSILVTSPFTTVDYRNEGGDRPSISSPLDLNDPNLGWGWNGGRVNIQNEKRVTETRGGRADLQFGEDKRNIKIGAAYDQAERIIRGFDNSIAWEQVVCRGGGGTICNGGPGSAIPNAALAGYLRPGPDGFITADFNRFLGDTNYYALRDSAPETNSANTGASAGGIREKNWGFYIETNAETEVWNRTLRFNAGVRYVTTDQTITGPVTINGIRRIQVLDSDYKETLPSFNAAWDVADNVVLRLSSSRTLTRPDPSAMLPNTNFSDPSAQTATQGNPNLAPYLSTNVDFGGEWYTGGEGYVGLTLFNKRISGFTVNGVRRIPFNDLGVPYESLLPIQQAGLDQRGGPNAATVDVQTQVNADGVLNIRGTEAIWVQPLDKLVDGLGFSVNYTHVTQSSEGEGIPAVAVGVAPNLWNGTVYWEKDAASVRLSYTWNDDMVISGANQNGIPYARLNADARGQLDLSASYALDWLPSKPQLTLNVTNLTDEPLRTTYAWPNATYDLYEPGRTVMLGIRGTF
ncbi:TonB-dependent receptor [Xanthomonas sp. BRIP62409]|uniref:TonB-dependent receptor n=1 Tax=Xanthomonas sp. BRIP62409 TaxID=2182388 RepID=UPI0013DFB0D5|nr:TonB-dependent receptor [Xanthomonas sp. BRIP62409]